MKIRKERYVFIISVLVIIISAVLLMLQNSKNQLIDLEDSEIGSNVNQFFTYRSGNVVFDSVSCKTEFPGLRVVFIKADSSDMKYFVLFNDSTCNRINVFSNDNFSSYNEYDSVYVRDDFIKKMKIKGLKEKYITRSVHLQDLVPIDFGSIIKQDNDSNYEFFKRFDNVVSLPDKEYFLFKDKMIFHLQNGDMSFFYIDRNYDF